LAGLPPTLILTGGCDTMRHEMNALAEDLQARRVRVIHRQFPGADHYFTHTKPAEVARTAIVMIGDLLRQAYSDPMTGA
jgi:acetyl esterase